MKQFADRSTPNKIAQGRIFSAFVLAAIFSLGTSLTILDSALAYPESVNQYNSENGNGGGTLVSQGQSDRPANRLPAQVANAVRRDASSRTGIALGKLKITESKQETWPNGCLGLAEPDQICTQALVEGWRVVVSDGQKTWVYRTDGAGKVVRLENQNVSVNSPKSSQLLVSQMSATGNIKPVQIPRSELPPPPDRGVIFQAISSGGITGQTYQTTLLNDGTLMRVRIGDANDSERSVRQISPAQVRQFQRLLERQKVSRFNGLSYQPPSGAADYITVTMVCTSFTTRYADIVQNRLPKPLQEVVQAWNQIASAR